jgi:hypothetical protein
MGLSQTNFVLLLFLLQLVQSQCNLLLDLLRFLEFVLGFNSHIFEVVHHLYLLLECGHLDLDLNGLLLELSVSQ